MRQTQNYFRIVENIVANAFYAIARPTTNSLASPKYGNYVSAKYENREIAYLTVVVGTRGATRDRPSDDEKRPEPRGNIRGRERRGCVRAMRKTIARFISRTDVSANVKVNVSRIFF